MKRIGACAWAVLAFGLAIGPRAADAAGPVQGYLAPGSVDVVAILPPAPVQGEVRYETDRAIFKATRHFAGSPRWAMATNDVKLAPADLLRDFSCALGVSLTPEQAPRLLTLLTKARSDTSRASNAAKDHFKRQRPFLIDQGPICQPADELKSYDYPSGHTTAGWTWAMVLAEVAPDRATAILARGRAYGDSRIICGAHNASAVDAGRLTAASVVAVLNGSAEFQADLKAAQDEFAGLRAGATPPPACGDEAALVAEPVY